MLIFHHHLKYQPGLYSIARKLGIGQQIGNWECFGGLSQAIRSLQPRRHISIDIALENHFPCHKSRVANLLQHPSGSALYIIRNKICLLKTTLQLKGLQIQLLLLTIELSTTRTSLKESGLQTESLRLDLDNQCTWSCLNTSAIPDFKISRAAAVSSMLF